MKRFALIGIPTVLALIVIALLVRLDYNRKHCQEIYGSNPWKGGGHRNTPWWCLSPPELRRRGEIEEVERDYHN